MFDGVVKKALTELLIKDGHTLVSDEESYDVDIITKKNGKKVYSEGEMKSTWVDRWPSVWPYIRIPERKNKLLKRYKEVDFYVFNKDLKKCWKIKSDLMREDTIRVAEGRNITMGEEFFHIPYVKAELIWIIEEDFF